MWSGIDTFTESMFLSLALEQFPPVLVDAHLGKPLLQRHDAAQIDVGDRDERKPGCAANALMSASAWPAAPMLA